MIPENKETTHSVKKFNVSIFKPLSDQLHCLPNGPFVMRSHCYFVLKIKLFCESYLFAISIFSNVFLFVAVPKLLS